MNHKKLKTKLIVKCEVLSSRIEKKIQNHYNILVVQLRLFNKSFRKPWHLFVVDKPLWKGKTPSCWHQQHRFKKQEHVSLNQLNSNQEKFRCSPFFSKTKLFFFSCFQKSLVNPKKNKQCKAFKNIPHSKRQSKLFFLCFNSFCFFFFWSENFSFYKLCFFLKQKKG